jgi:hypothetical protein
MNKLSPKFNVAATYVGNLIAATPSMLWMLASVISIGMDNKLPEVTAGELLVGAGVTAAGFALAATGYKRSFGDTNKEPLKRGALANGFNFVAASVGTVISGTFALAALGGPGDASVWGQVGLGVATGLALFTAGYTRFIGSGKTAGAVRKIFGGSEPEGPKPN